MDNTKTPSNEQAVDLSQILPIEGLVITDDKTGEVLNGGVSVVDNNISIVADDNVIPPIAQGDEVIIDTPRPMEDSRVIISATPYNLSFNRKNGLSAVLSFLCRDEADSLFVIAKTYILDTEMDIEALQDMIPFAERVLDSFPSERIAKHTLNCYLDLYNTDFVFELEEGFDKNPTPKVTFVGFSGKDSKMTRFITDPNVFACMAFIDRYIMDLDLMMENEHDLALASVGSSRELDNPVNFFVVDKVDSIVEMAKAIVPDEEPVTFKEKFKSKFKKNKEEPLTTEVGVVIKLKSETETVYMLAPFDLSEILDESKFKGKTISDIQDKYFGDSDQYVSAFMIPNIRLYGAVDKEYMIIRGRTKTGNVKIFLFDRYTIDDLYAKLKGEN